jgi:hypothetical protein
VGLEPRDYWDEECDRWKSLAGKTIEAAWSGYENWNTAFVKFTDGTGIVIEADGDVMFDLDRTTAFASNERSTA